MNRIPPFVRGMAIVALIALAVVVLNLQTSLSTAATLVRFGFYLAIAFAAYLLWRDFGRREIGIWPQRAQSKPRSVCWPCVTEFCRRRSTWTTKTRNATST